MQLSRSLSIPLSISALVVALAAAGLATAKGRDHGGLPDVDTHIERMTESLGLSGQQQEEIRAVLIEQRAKLETLRDQAHSEGRSPELREAIRETWVETKERIEASLSDQQIDAFRDDRHEHRAHRRHGRGDCDGEHGEPEEGSEQL